MFGLSKLVSWLIIAGVAVALLIGVAVADPFGWRKNLKARVVAAEQQTELTTETAAITERVIRSEVTIRTQAERSVDVVQTAPGADASIDPAFRDRLCAAVSGLRDGAAACDDQPAGGLDPP